MSGCAKSGPAMVQGRHDVVVDPVTRIEGHLRVEAVVEDGKIVDVRSSSQLFRGLEIILKGRDPRDAQHFTQRSCGVCTYVHALASIRCVDNAVGVDKELPHNATIIRNLVLASLSNVDPIRMQLCFRVMFCKRGANRLLPGIYSTALQPC